MHIDNGNVILMPDEPNKILKTARTHDMYISFEDDLLFEDNRDLQFNIRSGYVKPENVWIISYNNDAVNDDQLIYDISVRNSDDNLYRELFKACSFKAMNYVTQQTKGPSELLQLIKVTSDAQRFWDFVKNNQQIYKGEEEAEIHERELKGEDLEPDIESQMHIRVKTAKIESKNLREKEMVGLFKQFADNGRANKEGIAEKDVDPEELRMGIEVEYEHTTDKETAKRIALDHLAETKHSKSKYYTYLKEMEKRIEEEDKKAKKTEE